MENFLEQYAELVIRIGINLQQGQPLLINAPIECAEFAREIARAGFQAGAEDVKINWSDEKFAKLRFQKAKAEIFDIYPEWQRDMFMDFKARKAAVVSIHASDPLIFQDVSPEKMLKAQQAAGRALLEYRHAMMNNELRWCVVSVPTKAWAAKVFPEEASSEKAVEKLWQAILHTIRIDGKNDPIAAWRKHIDFLQRACAFMNKHKFTALQYKNSLGTDLQVKLPEGHIWCGGAEVAGDGIAFAANMPTEEIYTLPERNGTEGVVYASKPLNYNGNLISGIRLEFAQGRVVHASAEAGQDMLDKLLEVDEGARYLGEAALVPFDSPISNSGILFYNTLFDENAACHLALGKAYPTCLEKGETMDSAELARHGVNDSLIHEDFMIGTADMSITGIKANGERLPVFVEGSFADFGDV